MQGAPTLCTQMTPRTHNKWSPNVSLITRGIDWDTVNCASQKWVCIHPNRVPSEKEVNAFNSHLSHQALLCAGGSVHFLPDTLLSTVVIRDCKDGRMSNPETLLFRSSYTRGFQTMFPKEPSRADSGVHLACNKVQCFSTEHCWHLR